MASTHQAPDTVTLPPKEAAYFTSAYAKLSPTTQWDVRLYRDGDRYNMSLEPQKGEDGAVPPTRNGCFAATEHSRRGPNSEAACEAVVELDTEGCGRAWVTCPRHGTRRATWSEAMDQAAHHVRYGLMPTAEESRMIWRRHDMRNGRSLEELERVDRWLDEACDERVECVERV